MRVCKMLRMSDGKRGIHGVELTDDDRPLDVPTRDGTARLDVCKDCRAEWEEVMAPYREAAELRLSDSDVLGQLPHLPDYPKPVHGISMARKQHVQLFLVEEVGLAFTKADVRDWLEAAQRNVFRTGPISAANASFFTESVLDDIMHNPDKWGPYVANPVAK